MTAADAPEVLDLRSSLYKSLGLAALMLFCFPVLGHAAALRGIHIGDPCHKAIEVEVRSGLKTFSNPEEVLASRHMAIFKGAGEDGGKMEVFYRCTDDGATIRSMSVMRWPLTASAARAAYARDKAELQAELGTPELDTEAMTSWSRTRYWILMAPFDAVNETSSWAIPSGVRVTVEISQDRDTRNWMLYTLQGPTSDAGRHGSVTSSTTIPLDAVLLIVTTSAVLAALAATYAYSFRWPLVITISVVLSYLFFWLPTWQSGHTAPPAPEPGPSFPALIAGLLTTLMISSWIVRALGQRRTLPNFVAPAAYTRARRLIQIACGLLIAMELWIYWLFRPSQETDFRIGRLTLTVFDPLTLLLGLALAYLGATRLLKFPRREDHVAHIDNGFVAAGVLVVILSASGFVVGLLKEVLPR